MPFSPRGIRNSMGAVNEFDESERGRIREAAIGDISPVTDASTWFSGSSGMEPGLENSSGWRGDVPK
ncbi:hypothetical protein DACRYDRAFT_85920 [Dacryopinax primogenitus]|uniref:Uncharacterized protein n=1 Tax=Dacryopinax primogenitus (strain DJM 731) TaxID=1858805 RepID=M5GFA3_DACPD|nr:uncharacterized protein DACRYDRAFT_85920 [Dacryopinax primogenitus]EJU06092.1 hypothetical protein DACRYDRAFT_85920 [Dacryopinax primogenitus]